MGLELTRNVGLEQTVGENFDAIMDSDGFQTPCLGSNSGISDLVGLGVGPRGSAVLSKLLGMLLVQGAHCENSWG